MKTALVLLALTLGACAADSTPVELGTEPGAPPEATFDEAFGREAPGPFGGTACGTAAPGACEPMPLASSGIAPLVDAGVVVDQAAPSLSAPSALDGPCGARVRELLRQPALPGAPELEAKRTRILAYAKTEPVLFTRVPAVESPATPAARTYRSMIERASGPWGLVQRLLTVFAQNPALGRAVLLREGYLYAERPELAFALVDLVRAHHLFDEPRIWIQRGQNTLFAERSSGQYVYSDGLQRGQRVRLLLFDRIGAGEPSAPAHLDFRELRRSLGFDRVKIVHLADGAVAAELRYDGLWIPSVLEARGASLSLQCEVVPPDLAPRIAAFRAEQARKARVVASLRRAMLAGVDEGLPFDEPLTEYGQQDGQLRRFWLRAYQEGRASYELNGDRYLTFDVRGRPLVPQVCVDFVFDTLERASGTWWRPRGERPARVVGKLDFGTLSDETLRRAWSFVELAQNHPEWFDTHEVPESERIPLKHGGSLAEYLTEQADGFLPGDVVLIRGYAPWDKPWRPRVMHFHSFFVYESDPVTGFPSMLVGNPGRPLLQTWQFEAFRTPNRSIWYRMRPTLSWLEQVVEVNGDDETNFGVPPLAAGPT